MPNFALVNSSIKIVSDFDGRDWIFPMPSPDALYGSGFFAPGNVRPVFDSALGSYQMQADSVTNHTLHLPDWFIAGDASGSAVMVQNADATATMDAAMSTDFPATFVGEPASLSEALKDATTADQVIVPVIRALPAVNFVNRVKTCLVDWDNPPDSAAVCASAGPDDTEQVAVEPNYEVEFYNRPVTTTNCVYCLMDGLGGVRVFNATPDGESDNTIQVGSDEAALAVVGNLYFNATGETMPDGVVGYSAISIARREWEIRVSNLPTLTYDIQSGVLPITPDDVNIGLFYFPKCTVENSVVYNVIPGGPAPGGLPVFGFNFPTGSEQDSQFLRWSRPPFETRIPFQNYTFPVPRIVFRKEK